VAGYIRFKDQPHAGGPHAGGKTAKRSPRASKSAAAAKRKTKPLAAGSTEYAIAMKGPKASWPTVTGTAVGEHFGVHRREDGQFILTHRPTGHAVAKSRTKKRLDGFHTEKTGEVIVRVHVKVRERVIGSVDDVDALLEEILTKLLAELVHKKGKIHYFEMEGPAHVEIDEKRTGRLNFGLVSGEMDCRISTEGDVAVAEFSWAGSDEHHPVMGRGRAVIGDDGKMRGRIFMHHADGTGFVAERLGAAGKRKRRSR